MSDADFIVIGSGPAGVSAALALVEAGRRVLMLDGASREEPLPRSSAERTLGAALEALTVEDGLSPKLRSPEARLIFSRFARANAVVGENFLPAGALARGGLSRVWGGFSVEFGMADLEGWPLRLDQLSPSYARVTSRIGISGVSDDAVGKFLGGSAPLQPPSPVGTASRILQQRYAHQPAPGFLLGFARNAVLTVPLGGRPACDLRNDCLFGCPVGSIYDARQDLARLTACDNFRLQDGAIVTALQKDIEGWRVRTIDGKIFTAPRLLLAAGTLASTRLVAPLLTAMSDWPLLSNPVIATPLFVRAALNAATTRHHGLAQLAFFLPFGMGDYAGGAVYETAGLPPSTFVNQLPLGRRAGEAVFRFLSPGLLVAATSFAGRYSHNRLRFAASSGTLTVQGGFDESLPAVAKNVAKDLAVQWRRLGAVALPGSKLAMPGTDAHFAGTLPMGGRYANGTDILGTPAGMSGLHVVDGAVLPTLPAKHATLTIMANADRIGRVLANS